MIIIIYGKLAAENGHIGLVKELLKQDYKIDVTLKDNKGETASDKGFYKANLSLIT